MPGVADHFLVPVVWVAWLHLAAWSVGRPLAARLLRGGQPTSNPFLLTVIEVGVGLTVLAHVALLLGLTHLLYREVLLALGGILGLLGAEKILRARGSWRVRPRLQDAPLILAVAFLATFLPNALEPSLEHDDNVYHLLLPKTYLEAHALVALPFNLYANMPHLVEVLYTWPLAIWDFTAPKVASFSLHVWILAGLTAVVAPRAGRVGAGLVALLYVSGKNVQWHLGTAYVEPAIGLFLLVAVLAFLAWHETKNRGYLTIVAVMCGSAFASKYTGWFFGVAILLPAVISLARAPLPGRMRTRGALTLVAIAFAVLLPWLIKNAAVTGNPIYPNLHQYLGGRFWSDIQQLHYLRSQAYAGGAQGYVESFAAIPVNLTLKDNFYYCPSFSAAMMGLFLVALLLPQSWRPPARYVTVMALLGFLAWAFSVRQGRFLVAWVPVMALAASWPLVPIRRQALALLLVTALVIGAGAWQLRTQRYAYAPPIAMLSGSRASFIERNLNYAICQYLNDVVPADGKVLGLWDNRFFFLRRDFIADSAYEAPSGLAWLRTSGSVDAFVSELRAQGVTHVVINVRVMNSYLHNALAFDLIDETRYPPAQLAADRALVDGFIRQLDEVHRAGAVVVYRLKAG
jgi:hypothetical protein